MKTLPVNALGVTMVLVREEKWDGVCAALMPTHTSCTADEVSHSPPFDPALSCFGVTIKYAHSVTTCRRQVPLYLRDPTLYIY